MKRDDKAKGLFGLPSPPQVSHVDWLGRACQIKPGAIIINPEDYHSHAFRFVRRELEEEQESRPKRDALVRALMERNAAETPHGQRKELSSIDEEIIADFIAARERTTIRSGRELCESIGLDAERQSAGYLWENLLQLYADGLLDIHRLKQPRRRPGQPALDESSTKPVMRAQIVNDLARRYIAKTGESPTDTEIVRRLNDHSQGISTNEKDFVQMLFQGGLQSLRQSVSTGQAILKRNPSLPKCLSDRDDV